MRITVRISVDRIWIVSQCKRLFVLGFIVLKRFSISSLNLASIMKVVLIVLRIDCSE